MKKKAVSIEPSELIEFLNEELNQLPDKRTGSNKKYSIKNAVLAAFSVFFTQCPSFLQHQRLMKEKRSKDNAQSLFGLEEIPCDNQIRTLLDPIPAATVFGSFKSVYKWLEETGAINEFDYLDNQILLTLDGTEYYHSKNLNCSHCNQRKHRNGSITYYHQVITPVIVSPAQKIVINTAPEFIKKQDGKTKQDCENAAIKRWLLKNPACDSRKQITLLGDDLYACQPICELALQQGYNFIFVAKCSSHKYLYELIDFLGKNREIKTVEFKRYEAGKIRYYRYKYANNMPIRQSEPCLLVNWYEVEIFDSVKQKVIYQNTFITNHLLNNKNILKISISGKTRWKVENENYNILKTKGYNLEHNFGHGQENLSEILLSLNLLAFLFHNVLDLVNNLYQKTRKALGTRKTFFQNVRVLLSYIWFKTWQDLFVFILTKGDVTSVIDSS